MELFGGAITARYPLHYRDASEIREIPDSQEVHLSETDDTSIILEVLESVTPADSIEAITFHFNSLANDNEANESIISSTSLPTASLSPLINGPITLAGIQRISKFNTKTPDVVLILMALWRIPSKNADLVLTVNFPIAYGDADKAVVGPDGEVVHDVEGERVTREMFGVMVESLRIVDLGLFAG